MSKVVALLLVISVRELLVLVEYRCEARTEVVVELELLVVLVDIVLLRLLVLNLN